jgi:hypothetical protein
MEESVLFLGSHCCHAPLLALKKYKLHLSSLDVKYYVNVYNIQLPDASLWVVPRHGYNICFFYIETWFIFQVLFLIVMTSTEEECNFPDTLQGFGYAFNTGKGKIDFWKIKQICSYLGWTMGKIMLYEF